MKKSATSADSQFSTAIWDSSLPYPTSRSTPSNQSKSRLFPPPSLRLLQTFQSPEASEAPYPLLEHLYSPVARRDRLHREAGEVFYSVKYVGVCNGEMGVLSQRKALLSERQKRAVLPSNPTLMGDSSSGLDAVPQEFLHPAPERYAEYLVHTYTRPRPLTATNSVRTLAKSSSFATIEAGRFYQALHHIQPAKVPRRGVSGWKLTSPKQYARPRAVPFRPAPVPPRSPLLDSVQTGSRQRNEAYLQYLRLKGRSKH